jgi:Reverse transcriptase (RNA-dependent DNA polymerase)
MSEEVYIVAGPEFGEREGHIVVISKALYGLQSSGARWHDRFADYIRELRFFPFKAEPDIWMRKKHNQYEYITVYVDDLAIAMEIQKNSWMSSKIRISSNYGYRANHIPPRYGFH